MRTKGEINELLFRYFNRNYSDIVRITYGEARNEVSRKGRAEMDRAVDEMTKEIEELRNENQRLESLLDDTMHTLRSMAEGMAMLTNPVWTEVRDKDKLIDDIVFDWIERSFDERTRYKRG